MRYWMVPRNRYLDLHRFLESMGSIHRIRKLHMRLYLEGMVINSKHHTNRGSEDHRGHLKVPRGMAHLDPVHLKKRLVVHLVRGVLVECQEWPELRIQTNHWLWDLHSLPLGFKHPGCNLSCILSAIFNNFTPPNLKEGRVFRALRRQTWTLT